MTGSPASCPPEDRPARIAALERAHDGEPPPEDLALALLGSSRLAGLLRAEAEAAFFAAMLRGQRATIRRRRADGTFYPALLADLALYRRQFRDWRRLARALGADA